MVAPRYYQEPAEDPRTERERLLADLCSSRSGITSSVDSQSWHNIPDRDLATLASVLAYAESQSEAVGAILDRVSGRIKGHTGTGRGVRPGVESRIWKASTHQ